MAYVYRHIRLDKNIPFYIGIAKDDDGKYRRANCSLRTRGKKSIIWAKIASKSDYEVEIIYEGLSWDAACEKEREFIKLYGRIDKGTGILANMTDGGDGSKGFVCSQDVKDRHSKRMKGKRHSLGHKQTDEHKLKISQANKGKKMSEEHRIKMLNRRHTESAKEKMRLSKIGNTHKKGFKLSDETKMKMSISKIGVKKSEKAKANMSLAQMGNKNMLGKKMPDSVKKKISDTKKGSKHSIEAKNKIRLASLKMWETRRVKKDQ